METTHIDDLAVRLGPLHGARNDRRDVRDIRERTRLKPVALHRHRLTGHQAVHEDPDNVPVPVGDVLTLPVDVVGPEDHVGQAEHLRCLLKVHLDRKLGDSVGSSGIGVMSSFIGTWFDP